VSSASESEGIDGIFAPVMQITQELHELCEEYFVKLPLELGSVEALAVASVPSPSQKPASKVSGEVLENQF
jgi:hypothetical protein